MDSDAHSKLDEFGTPKLVDELLGKPMTAEDWVECAGWWIDHGGALPDASPMFKALVDVLRECQRRSAAPAIRSSDPDWGTVNAHGRVISLVVGSAIDECGQFSVQVQVDGKTCFAARFTDRAEQ